METIGTIDNPESGLERPILERLRERSTVDWGEAPKYNKDYRKIRWPGTPARMRYFRLIRPEDRPNNSAGMVFRALTESPVVPGHQEVSNPVDGETVDRTVAWRVKPAWIETIAYQKREKARGRWSKNKAKTLLVRDIRTCMSENIPFKTKTFEYRPSDQWLYVHGVPAMKVSLITGYISHITFGGVYNKVTSLILRMFGIYIRLKGRKLVWYNEGPMWLRNMDPNNCTAINPIVDIDINKVYTYSDFYMDAHPWQGFHIVSSPLFREFQRTQQAHGHETQFGNGRQRLTGRASQW